MRETPPQQTYDIQFFELFVSLKGRISRRVFLGGFLLLFITYLNGYLLLNLLVGKITSQAMYLFIPFAWGYLAIYIKRFHDFNRSGYQLLLLLIPVVGPLYVNLQAFFRKGSRQSNRYGMRQHQFKFDYFTNPQLAQQQQDVTVNDVTQINPIMVEQVIVPSHIDEIVEWLTNSDRPVCIGGGRFSMGGQTASAGAVHIDMRHLNRILNLCLQERTIRVQAGIRWCDIQKHIDPFNLALSIMQTYANFTVGGSLSVNSHGRYMGLGPLVFSVKEILLILADGKLVTASPQQNSELFYAAVGGYGGIGIIVEVELMLTQNIHVQRHNRKMAIGDYFNYFCHEVRQSDAVVFHNADIYPTKYARVNAVSWVKTDRAVTTRSSLQRAKRIHPIMSYFLWAIAKTPFGKWRREYIVDKLLFASQAIHSRNYEAGYNVAELAPISTERYTWVLQEYFVPIKRFDDFSVLIAEILQRYDVNALNISIRHAKQDPGTMLAWAPTEVFAFVLYYRQGVTELDKNRVAIWTRELIAAVLSCDGTYYLPYQIHATAEQFHQAYPKAKAFFELKKRVDPNYRLRNQLWDSYYQVPTTKGGPAMTSEFKYMLADPIYHDKLYLFLQNIFHLFPEDKFFALIKDATANNETDQAIYQHIQEQLKTIKPFLSDLTYALPALFKQKKVMVKQTLDLLDEETKIDGYVEIGSTGRYIGSLKKGLSLSGPIYLIHEEAPSNSIVDILERGQLKKIGQYIPLDDYAPIARQDIADASVDLVTCYIGLHHASLDNLHPFIQSIVRILRPGGRFILRDHHCPSDDMKKFCSLIHSVFNIGTNISCADNNKELRYFRAVDEWCQILSQYGLTSDGRELLQDHDPSDNTFQIIL